MDSTSRLKLANAISIVGHPLLLMALTATLIAFELYEFSKAVIVAGVIIVIVIAPVTLHLLLKTKQKAYTNFDVSDRKQRESFYKFGIVALGLATLTLYFLPDAREFFLGTLYAFLMMVVSALVNLKVKSSLHTSAAIYVAFSCLIFNLWIGIVMFLFAALIALSRVALERHTKREVIVGGVIGICFGLLLMAR